MAGPRAVRVDLSRPTVFRPYTSLRTNSQSTKTPDFEFLIPRTASDEIVLSEAKWPTQRFVYVFMDPRFLTIFMAVRMEVGSGPNGLYMVIRVEADGTQAACFGSEYKQAMISGSPPPFSAQTTIESFELEPDIRGVAESYTIAAPILLPLTAIAALEAQRPATVPKLGTGVALGVKNGTSAPNQRSPWVVPVVDPLFLADDLTRKYYEAADNFLASAQEIDRPPARSDADRKARREGDLARLRKAIADNLVALKRAAPTQGGLFFQTLRVGFPEQEVEQYQAFVSRLVELREIAAFELIAWLESALFTSADDWWDRNQGQPDASYDNYVFAVANALARLSEADHGVQYLMDLRRRIDQGSSPAPSGVLNVINEFIFRTTRSSAEQRTIAEKASAAVFQTWAGFVAMATAVRQRVVSGPNPTTSLVQDLRSFADSLAFTFQTRVLDLDVTPLQLEAPVANMKTTVVSVPMPEFRVGAVRRLIRATKLTADHLNRVAAVLNLGVAYAALRAALDEGGDARARAMGMADLAGASFGFVDQVQGAPLLENVRARMAGKLNVGGALAGNRLSSTLGLLGAVASLTSASLSTADAFDRGDWDKAVAHMTEGFGAVLVATGSAVILVSGTTGPFALWTIGIGTAVSAAGFIWSVFAADTELEQMLKFCVFGRDHKSRALSPGWSQCRRSFDEWDGDSPRGLIRQLKAFQQIFYSFEVSGANAVLPGPLASDGIVRITPASLRLACSFELVYTAVYVLPGGALPSVTLNGKATVLIPKSPTGAPVLVDDRNNYQTVGAIRVHRDGGRDALDVRLRLRTPLVQPRTNVPFELESLTCLVQLKVPDVKVDDIGQSDGTLVVPTTVDGPKAVPAVIVRRGRAEVDGRASVKI